MNLLLFCCAALVLLYAALSLNVSRMRLKKRAHPQNVTEADLTKAIRAHGNAAEYVPLFVALLLWAAATRPSALMGGIAVVATLSRFAHAAGMFRIADVGQRHPLRYWGAVGTYLCLFALGGALLLSAF